ncbi:ABC transporter ATP-binding protein [Enterococcus sp.]|uniref:ABC transporter ATP-binding protein n=1 Tax=Enterococcus sp. TaxID=35783 RepID=UPI00290CF1AC|nr:ABC transporter ATP-binding protein [Enterococcus sp.]MDU5335042.1 ABC transporter ATP-binding protein [Enterococcus sp.]
MAAITGEFGLEAKIASSKISFERVNKIYRSKKNEVVALKNINLDILDNEFLCVVGPSGCGKSTLLKILGGLDDMTSGSIVLNDRELVGPGADRGMVFQGYSLFPWLNVEENIAFGLKIAKKPKEKIKEIVDRYIEAIGLEKFRKSLPKELSGGMKQRVAIARSLANSPEVLLMDEPFGALDPETKSSMQLLMREIWEVERPTILFITHDIEEAAFLGQRVVIMSSGPGEIKETIPIYLPYQRGLALKDDPQFISIKKEIDEIIHR